MSDSDLNRQADILTDYLIQKSISNAVVYDLYRTVVTEKKQQDETKLINFAFRHPSFIPSLDAGLVFVRPESELRRRIYIMFATLESMPEYSNLFLPEKTGTQGFIRVIGSGIRAVYRAIIGVILLKVARL